MYRVVCRDRRCPIGALTGSQAEAEVLAAIHDDIHHRGHQTATAQSTN